MSGSLRAPLCLVACLFCVVALVACGGDSTSTSSTATARMPEQPGSGGAEDVNPPAAGFEDDSDQTDIPAFGFEAADEQRSEAQVVLSAYLAGVARADWGSACGFLAAPTRAQLLRLVQLLEEAKHEDCAEALRLSLKSTFGGRGPYSGPATISALRIKAGGTAGEGAGFALFHGEDGRDYWITMRREAGHWTVSSPGPQVLP